MKPYQLLGLSFLVYLHRNGLSGILGDEMGLGKTLQTLSLIQYLKESRKLSTSSKCMFRSNLVLIEPLVLSRNSYLVSRGPASTPKTIL